MRHPAVPAPLWSMATVVVSAAARRAPGRDVRATRPCGHGVLAGEHTARCAWQGIGQKGVGGCEVAGDRGSWHMVVQKLLRTMCEASVRGAQQHLSTSSRRESMHPGLGISDYLSMIAIVAMLVSLWMH